MTTQLKILLLEDFPADVALVEYALRSAQLNFVSRRVETREAYLRALQEFEPDVVLADYNLPDLTGLDAIRLLREHRKSAVFILVTGTQTEEVAVECIKEGADDYILKTSLKRLPKAVQNALDKRNAEREREKSQEALRQSDLRYRLASRATNDVIWDLDLITHRTERNEAVQSLLGFPPSEIRNDYEWWNALVHPDDRDRITQSLENVFKKGSNFWAEEYRIRKRDGSYAYVYDRAFVIFDDTAKPVRVIGAMMDLSERRHAEEMVRRSEELNRRILEAVPGGIVLVGMNGAILKANEEAQRILGLRYDKLQSMFVADFRHTTIFEDGSECKVEDYPVSRCLATGQQQPALTMGVKREDGTISWAIYTATPVHDPNTGIMTGSVVTFVDISERKRTEEALRESEQRFRTLTENTPTGIWHITADGRTIYGNQALGRILEIDDVRDIRGLSVYQFFTPESVHKIAEEGKLREQGLATKYELDLITKNGNHRQIIIHGAPMFGPDGKLQSRMGSVVDITDLKRAEEERRQLERKLLETQKLESLGVLAGGVAHDFNNLLAAVLGNVNLAAMHLHPDSPARTYLQSVEATTHRAADLCKQMLAYSGRGRFVVQPINVNNVIQEMAELLKISIGKGVNLNLRLARELPEISADATQVRQILMNLIINASEAIGGKSGVISITTGVARIEKADLMQSFASPDFVNGDYIVIEVADTGCGMDEKTRARIFDPFFSTKFTGRGLGLAAVLGIIRGHKGAVTVQSAVGKGTTFKVFLPCIKVQPAVATAEKPAALAKVNGKVLVVDDDETLRTLQARMLAALGIQAELAANGSEAIAFLSKNKDHVAAVLLDLTMPGLSGEETCRELLQIKPDLPLILMSGFEAQDILERISNPKVRFLQKPFTSQNLQAELADVLTN